MIVPCLGMKSYINEGSIMKSNSVMHTSDKGGGSRDIHIN